MSEEASKISDQYSLSLSYSEINPTEAFEFVRSESCGAVHLFLGTTRDTERVVDEYNDTSVMTTIEHLYYESYTKMAVSLMESIVKQEIENNGEIRKVYVKHRLGCVPVGHASIAIAASSVHRQAAHSAVVRILEQIKRTVPVWKRIQFADKEKRVWSEKSEAFWLRKEQQ